MQMLLYSNASSGVAIVVAWSNNSQTHLTSMCVKQTVTFSSFFFKKTPFLTTAPINSIKKKVLTGYFLFRSDCENNISSNKLKNVPMLYVFKLQHQHNLTIQKTSIKLYRFTVMTMFMNYWLQPSVLLLLIPNYNYSEVQRRSYLGACAYAPLPTPAEHNLQPANSYRETARSKYCGTSERHFLLLEMSSLERPP